MTRKTRKTITMMLAIMFAPIIGAYAQANEITLSKPGRLEKELGKSSDTITTLKVNGDINGKDIECMISMPKLISLDLGNARISENYSYPTQNKPLSGLSKSIGIGNTLDSKNYNKQTLIISGSRFYNKVVMPVSCNNLVILPPQPSDSVYALDYYQMGRLEAASGLNSITCSKQFLPAIIDVKNHALDNKQLESFFSFLLIQQDKVFLRYWPWDMKILSTYCERQKITFIDNIFPYGFRRVPCGDTLDLSQVNIKQAGQYAFAECQARYIIMPRTIEAVSGLAFEKSNVETVEFIGEYAPVIGDHSWELSVIVPDEYYQNYQLGEWKDLVVKKKNANTKHEFLIEKPGSLSDYLTDEIVRNVETLTLKGILYDTEIDRLNDCKGLKYLDISCCYVAKSPQTVEKERANREFQLAVLQMLGEMVQKDAESKFEQGTISYSEAMNNVMWGKYAEMVAEQVSKNKIEADANCICPELNLKLLKEYHMPAQIKIIRHVGYLPMLEKIVLPPGATEIFYYAFSGLKKLKDISFPKTLEYMGNAAFKNCKSLTKLDFSNTNLKEIVIRKSDIGKETGIFYGCDELEEVRFPASLMTLADDGVVPMNCVLYFYSKEVSSPRCWWEPKSIHVPRGTKAGWSRWITYGVNVIDDL